MQKGRVLLGLDTPESSFDISGAHSDGSDGQQTRSVPTVGKKRIAVLKQSHRPTVLFPGEQLLPLKPIETAVHANFSTEVHATRLDHGGEKYGITDPASINGGTADCRQLLYIPAPIKTIHMVGFKWRIG